MNKETSQEMYKETDDYTLKFDKVYSDTGKINSIEVIDKNNNKNIEAYYTKNNDNTLNIYMRDGKINSEKLLTKNENERTIYENERIVKPLYLQGKLNNILNNSFEILNRNNQQIKIDLPDANQYFKEKNINIDDKIEYQVNLVTEKENHQQINKIAYHTPNKDVIILSEYSPRYNRVESINLTNQKNISYVGDQKITQEQNDKLKIGKPIELDDSIIEYSTKYENNIRTNKDIIVFKIEDDDKFKIATNNQEIRRFPQDNIEFLAEKDKHIKEYMNEVANHINFKEDKFDVLQNQLKSNSIYVSYHTPINRDQPVFDENIVTIDRKDMQYNDMLDDHDRRAIFKMEEDFNEKEEKELSKGRSI